ncbi:hypothetical protein E2C01_053350 [Portunus trituberculatus]|uniref:Uncharacterized protein n=1 Tax=Portunus trituberculatus TaxID=210409 RepID=A0A5B7GK28_PORTR|nr:hypothetical protein [Portunus trituberculatus]
MRHDFQAIRSIVDYAAPVLATAQPSQIDQLQKLQNAVLRLMLGAPQWSKLCNLRAEAKIPQLLYRVRAISLNLLAGKATHPRHSAIVRSVTQTLAARPGRRPFQEKDLGQQNSTQHKITAS